jgi:hypothetical protein
VWFQGGLGWPTDAQRLANGNTLIADERADGSLSGGAVKEFTPEGNVAWQIAGLRQLSSAVRLSSGLTVTGSRNSVDAFDAEGDRVWQFHPEPDAGPSPLSVVGF